MIGTQAQGTIDYINMMIADANTTAEELNTCYEMESNLYARHFITEAVHGRLRSRIRDAIGKVIKA